MRAASTLTAIGSALWLAASSVHALGFGRVATATQLGQPLNFAAVLRLDPDETLARECVSAEVQSGENKLPAGQVRTTLEGGAEAGERSVRVTTTAIIDEPVVTVSVTIGCDAKITRRFVVFIDPPLVNLAQASPPVTLPPQRNDSQVAPVVTVVQGDAAASAPAPRPPPARPRPRPAGPAPILVPAGNAGERAAAPAAKPLPPRRPGPQPAAPVASNTGPRLKLETAPPSAATAAPVASGAASSPFAVAAALAAAEAASSASAAAASRAASQAEQIARERDRIQLLEDGLKKLRADSQTTQQTLQGLQTRLKQAESERYANPLVYGLAWLSALLALAVATLLWRQSRGGAGSQWWTAPTPAPAPAVDARSKGATSIAGALASSPQSLDDPITGAGAFNIPTVVEDDDAPVTRAPATRPAPFAPIQIAPMAAPEAPRELSVEELIDLEQQAEFFIVLGQDDAAIELLMSHVRTDGGISPLPYLKLLEIYRRRGENESYERIRDRFNRRFNAYAPDWEADLQHGRVLADYPDTIARLQALWATPARVMETLDASLFRRNKAGETFDLPAYRELLFLYSIARDLAEHGGTAAVDDVDLLLPFSDEPTHEPISRLSATGTPAEFRSSDMMTLALDLDVSLVPGAVKPIAAAPPPSASIDFDLDQPIPPGAPPGEPKP